MFACPRTRGHAYGASLRGAEKGSTSMESETGREDSREEEIRVLREGAALIEMEAVGLVTAAVVLEAEADHLEDQEREIHFSVDGEDFETAERILTGLPEFVGTFGHSARHQP